jgi:hypothetical protein
MRVKFIRKLLQLSILIGLTLLFLIMTNPSKLPSFALVVPFVLITIILYLALMTFIEYIKGSKNSDHSVYIVRPRVVAAMVAGFPVILLVLQSIGQLSLRDVLTVVTIFLLVYFYSAKFTIGSSSS